MINTLENYKILSKKDTEVLIMIKPSPQLKANRTFQERIIGYKGLEKCANKQKTETYIVFKVDDKLDIINEVR